MKNILTIAQRDVASNFVTPIAYVVLAGYMLLSGFFFFTLLQQFNAVLQQAAMMPNVNPSLNEWVVMPFYQTMQVVLIFLVPILTMRSIAEEKRSGTFELLVTSPLRVSDIVLGKFLGLGLVMVLMLSLSFIYPLVLIVFADPEVMPIFIGFLGMLLFTMSFSAMGLAVSSFTKSQTVAGVVSLVLLLVFYVIDAPAAQLGGTLGDVFKYLAPSNHAESMFKGVLQGVDIVYFLSLMLLGIFIGNRVLDAQRWR